MALYIMVVQGGTPIGSPIMGWVAEVFGGRWALTIGTGVCTIAALWALVFWSREHRRAVGDRWKTYTTRARERVRWRPRNAN